MLQLRRNSRLHQALRSQPKSGQEAPQPGTTQISARPDAAGPAGEAPLGPAAPRGARLTPLEASFAGQIATAVWLDKLSDESAREALLSYAIACGLCDAASLLRLRSALVKEYAAWRERQDLVS